MALPRLGKRCNEASVESGASLEKCIFRGLYTEKIYIASHPEQDRIAMSRPLSAREIEAFRAVMQTGTTTAAARLLHTTQPSVSRLLAQMQAAAGLKLFDMHKGRLRPTAEAVELFATVQQHFLGRERIERDLAALRQSGAGTLRIGCTPALGLSVIPAVVRSFAQRYRAPTSACRPWAPRPCARACCMATSTWWSAPWR